LSSSGGHVQKEIFWVINTLSLRWRVLMLTQLYIFNFARAAYIFRIAPMLLTTLYPNT